MFPAETNIFKNIHKPNTYQNPTTPPKFNMEPENHGFQKGLSFSRDLFSGSMLNFGGVGLYVRRCAGLKGDSFQVVAFFDGVLMLNTDLIDVFKLRAS